MVQWERKAESQQQELVADDLSNCWPAERNECHEKLMVSCTAWESGGKWCSLWTHYLKMVTYHSWKQTVKPQTMDLLVRMRTWKLCVRTSFFGSWFLEFGPNVSVRLLNSMKSALQLKYAVKNPRMWFRSLIVKTCSFPVFSMDCWVDKIWCCVWNFLTFSGIWWTKHLRKLFTK